MQCSPRKEILLASPGLTWLNSSECHGGGLGRVGLPTAISQQWSRSTQLLVRCGTAAGQKGVTRAPGD